MNKKFLMLSLLGLFGLGTTVYPASIPEKNVSVKVELKDEKSKLLESRVNSFFDSINKSEYERVYDLLSQSLQRDIPRDKYISGLKKMFDSGEMSINYSKPKIIETGENHAITESIVSISFNVKDSPKQNFSQCERAFFVLDKDNWYFFRGGPCEYDFKDLIDEINKGVKENPDYFL